MNLSHLTNHEVVELGESIYEREIRERVEPAYIGKFVAIDISNGTYTLEDRMLQAVQRAHDLNADGRFYVKRIGYESAVRIGGSALRMRS